MQTQNPADQRPILIISHDVVGEHMAGPGIRYYHLARILGRQFPVTLAVPVGSSIESVAFDVLEYTAGTDSALATALSQARVVLVSAIWFATMPGLAQTQVPVIIDGYNPFIAEALIFQTDNLDDLQMRLAHAYLGGDFFICASERQRDWWLGVLEANGRVNPWTFQDDPSLRRLIDVVAYGLPETPPQHTRRVIKGAWPGISDEDRLILWGGGLWSWLDPLTAIRAVAKVWEAQPNVRLVFPGTRHPNPGMANAPTHNEGAKALAQDLGVLDKAVFFGDWIPYEDWPNVLVESDLALSLHFETLETRLAFRSRVLEYIWAALPIIATRGDATGQLIERHQLGRLVDYEAVDEVAEAILFLLNRPNGACWTAAKQAQAELNWQQVAQPLVHFCEAPYQAADKAQSMNRLGHPFYRAQRAQQARLEAIIADYEKGRFIRLMRKIDQLKKRWLTV